MGTTILFWFCILVEYIDTSFNQVETTVKFDPLCWWPFDFMQIKRVYFRNSDFGRL